MDQEQSSAVPGSGESGQARVGLARTMTLFHVTMIGVGAMIGAGIFVLTGLAAGRAGPALIVAFLLNGVVTGLTALTYAELGSCFPEAGGGYLWVKQGLPGANGFLAGWMSWFAHAVACSLYALGFGAYLLEAAASAHAIPALSPGTSDLITKGLAVGVVLAFTYINFRGAAEAGAAEGVATVAKLIILALFIGSGLWVMGVRGDWQPKFSPFFATGLGGVLGAMGLTFIAFEGYEIIAQCGEEVRRPERNIPRAVLLSLAVVIPIYVLVAVVCIGALSTGETPTWQFLRDLQRPELGVVEAARQFMVGGPGLGALILLVGGIFSTMSALNATVYSSSRVSYAMGRDHNLPRAFSRIHSRRRTPHIALLVSAAIIVVMAIALPIEKVAAAADLMFMYLFLQVNIAVMTLRRRRPDLQRTFRVPLVPVVPVLAIGSLLVLTVFLVRDHPISFIYSFVWVGLGLGVHHLYARPREREARVSAEVVVHEAAEQRPYAVLVALANPSRVPNLMALACAAAKRRNGRVVALSVVTVPAPTPLAAGIQQAKQAEPLLDRAVEEGRRWDVPVDAVVRVGRRVTDAILDAAEHEEAELLVVGWRGYSDDATRVLSPTLDPLIRRAHCDIAVLKAQEPLPGTGPDDEGKLRIVCPTTGSRHGLLAMDLAAGLVDLVGGHTHYLHAVGPEDTVAPGVQNMIDAGIDVELVRTENMQETVVQHGAARDLIIMGAARESAWRQVLFGTKTETVARGTETPVLLVKRGLTPAEATLREMFRPLEPEEIMAFEEAHAGEAGAGEPGG